MMLAHLQLESVIDFSSPEVNTLIIENQDFFRNFLQDIRFQLDGFSGKSVLSEKTYHWTGAKTVSFWIAFSLSTWTASHFCAKFHLLWKAPQWQRGTTSKPWQFFPKLNAIWMTWFSPRIAMWYADDYPDPLERLLDYMELVRCYERNKLFIFVNLRSYFPDDSVQRFLQTTIDHQYTLLLVW